MGIETSRSEAALWAAYRETRFQADIPGARLEIVVDERHPQLDEVVRNAGETEWMFITAWNPRSRSLDAAENARLNGDLETSLRAAGLQNFTGRGVPADSRWEPEESFLVLGVAREEAIRQGRQWAQNAVVWGAVDGPAELLDCR